MSVPTQISVITVVGARPNFMKAAPILRAIREHNEQGKRPQIRHLLVHTGQHYDALMSDQFFTDLSLPKPDVHLGVGSGSQGAQTAEILKKFEEVVSREWPDLVVVVGDVNSTVACALTTAKLPSVTGRPRPLIAHVEAGLRSFDRSMPEEINRIVTDHLADILFVTEQSGLVNLEKEGIPFEKIFFVGNAMIDSLLTFKDRADASTVLERLGLRDQISRNGSHGSIVPYGLLTLHRPANVDERDPFARILEGVRDLARQYPIVFPVHPRTKKRIDDFGFRERLAATTYTGEGVNQLKAGIHLVDPLGYLDFLCLMKNARMVLTDSGGIQEETTCLGVPCVTIRENTERPVTITSGSNILAGTTSDGIRTAIQRQMDWKVTCGAPEKWDGKAGVRIVQTVAEIFSRPR